MGNGSGTPRVAHRDVSGQGCGASGDPALRDGRYASRFWTTVPKTSVRR